MKQNKNPFWEACSTALEPKKRRQVRLPKILNRYDLNWVYVKHCRLVREPSFNTKSRNFRKIEKPFLSIVLVAHNFWKRQLVSSSERYSWLPVLKCSAGYLFWKVQLVTSSERYSWLLVMKGIAVNQLLLMLPLAANSGSTAGYQFWKVQLVTNSERYSWLPIFLLIAAGYQFFFLFQLVTSFSSYCSWLQIFLLIAAGYQLLFLLQLVTGVPATSPGSTGSGSNVSPSCGEGGPALSPLSSSR